MNIIKELRTQKGLTQRGVAELAGLSFGTIQLTESGKHDPKVSTLEKINTALGYVPNALTETILNFYKNSPDSIPSLSRRISEKNWKLELFDFVDNFRNTKDFSLIDSAPLFKTPTRLRALIASTVETLCDELELDVPNWISEIPALGNPWFVAEIENLKASAIKESPLHFRKRNIFVLENFLSRA